MALKSGLALYCYTAPTANTLLPLYVREYSQQIEALRFTTVNPGGYGQMSALLKVPDARIPRPELALFSRVAITDGAGWWWLGEITDPRIGLRNDSEYIQIGALGLGNQMRDDPHDITFTAQTVQQIAQFELSHHNYVTGSTYNNWLLDPDASGLFPDNPAGTYSPAFDARTFEELLGDLVLLAANNATGTLYTYWTAAHPSHTDTFGFPTLQVWAAKKDTLTTTFQASVAAREAVAYEITPTADRAYNFVQIDYNSASGGLAHVYAIDSRLTPVTFSQGTAPFRFRKLHRDYSGNPAVTPSTAQNIANTLLAQYKNVSNKASLTVLGVRDYFGQPVNLWRLCTPGNQNIFVPEVAVRGAALAFAPVAGVNQFYIVSAEYSETANGDARVTMQCDNWGDHIEAMLARLTLYNDTLLRSQRKGAQFQKPGAPITGECGISGTATANGQRFGSGQSFRATATNTPTSITLGASPLQNNNTNSATCTQITADGFHLTVLATASGQFDYVNTYSTNGNCLLDVDEARGTFDHHCDGCDVTRRGLSLRRDLRVDPQMGGMSVDCPLCGASEHFNTRLLAEHEDEWRMGNAHSAGQARLIRRAMRHPHVGLATMEERAATATATAGAGQEKPKRTRKPRARPTTRKEA